MATDDERQEAGARAPGFSVEAIAEHLEAEGLVLGVAESLTGGLLASRFAAAPGSSSWFQGGIVAYATAVKHDLLGVSPGPVVSERAAREMAAGAARALGAEVTVAVTGVGGPSEQDGQPPGMVWMPCTHRVAPWPTWSTSTPSLRRCAGARATRRSICSAAT